MEAKDTVMDERDIKNMWESWPNDKPAAPTFDQWLCQAQSEISFKAGRKSVLDELKHAGTGFSFKQEPFDIIVREVGTGKMLVEWTNCLPNEIGYVVIIPDNLT